MMDIDPIVQALAESVATLRTVISETSSATPCAWSIVQYDRRSAQRMSESEASQIFNM